MLVAIDDKSGFCFGVVNAITKAEASLNEHQHVYSLGDIVHNRIEMKRLEEHGLESIDHTRLHQLKGETILIRAHGEPPATYDLAKKCGVNLVDATCPVVAKLQERVKLAHQQMAPVGGQVVILGKKGHAEVVGLTGQIDEQAIVIEHLEDLDLIDFERPIYLLSQTTQSLTLFEELKAAILAKTADKPHAQVVIRDTICRQVSNRNPHLKEFSARYDVIVFVSGIKSSNGKALYQTCLESNPRSYKVEDEHDLQWSWFEGCTSVGVCGATSTPKWLMEQIAQAIDNHY